MIKIAVILTCYNRRELTLSCLRTLFSVADIYNNKREYQAVSLSVYLTDDSCTDGTGEAVRSAFPEYDITIMQGNGNLYWAGGMRLAWGEAIKKEWDYYLLLNDDTDLLPNLFDELFSTMRYSREKFGKEGLVSGLTSAKDDHNKTTYGGGVRFKKTRQHNASLLPDEPHRVDVTNANILLIHHSVVDKLGIFYEGFRHGNADYDYALHAGRAKFPVLITANYCGRCDHDHDSFEEYRDKILSMNLHQRKEFLNHPIRSSKDYLMCIRRNAPMRYPLVAFGRWLNLYFPKVYYWLYNKR